MLRNGLMSARKLQGIQSESVCVCVCVCVCVGGGGGGGVSDASSRLY